VSFPINRRKAVAAVALSLLITVAFVGTAYARTNAKRAHVLADRTSQLSLKVDRLRHTLATAGLTTYTRNRVAATNGQVLGLNRTLLQLNRRPDLRHAPKRVRSAVAQLNKRVARLDTRLVKVELASRVTKSALSFGPSAKSSSQTSSLSSWATYWHKHPTPPKVVTPTPTPAASTTPTPTITASAPPVPAGAVTVTPSSNLQSAINALGTKGGTIVFSPGTYTVSTPLELPANNSAMLTLSGYGATIDLTASTPRFLVWNYSSGSLFRHFTVAGFAVNAENNHPSSGSYSPIGFDMQSGSSIYDAGNISIEDLTVQDITGTNIATSPTSAWNPCDVNIYTNGAQHVTGVTVTNVHLLGGSRGIDVWAGPGSVTMDQIVITNNWHDTGMNPTSFSASTNYQIGQDAHLGTLVMTNNFGARAFDCGIEVDNAENATLTGNVEQNCYYNEFYYTNFATPLSGAGEMTLQNDTASVTTSVYGGTGLGVGWEGVNIGTINVNNFTSSLSYGTKTQWTVASGVVMQGLLLNGVKVR
jgi:hypothetical protein